jgi:hypothetical protein
MTVAAITNPTSAARLQITGCLPLGFLEDTTKLSGNARHDGNPVHEHNDLKAIRQLLAAAISA